MTRKDYKLLADVIADFMEKSRDRHAVARNLIVPLAHRLKKDNPRFNHAKWLTACGVVVEEAQR